MSYQLSNMGLGLGISVDWASLVPYYAKVASAFAARVKADGGTVENTACLKKDLKVLSPTPPTGYLLTDYPSAVAAYSLRLLNKTYAGSAIRVRRGTDNAEQNIGFASEQLDTEALETFAGSGDAFVTTWYDQSGNDYNVTQTTASNQPQIVSSGTSFGYVKTFNTQRLATSSNLWLNGVDYSIFGVMKNLGNNLFISGNGDGYSAVSANGNGSVGSHFFTEGDRYKNGSLIGATWGDMYNATTSFAAMSLYATKIGANVQGSLGGYITSYNNSELKEYIVYPNQTISRTGVENNIITHYGF